MLNNKVVAIFYLMSF